MSYYHQSISYFDPVLEEAAGENVRGTPYSGSCR